MTKFFKNLFKKSKSNQTESGNKEIADLGDKKIIEAVTVMLLRASSIDGSKDKKEIILIKRLLSEQFALSNDEIELLVIDCSKKEQESTDLYKWSKIINDNYSKEKKNIVFGMMCEIINADGVVDPFESNFIRRLSGLLYISDKDAGIIKKKILKVKEV